MAKELDVKVKLTKDEKKNTSLRLKGKTLKALKVRAIEENTSVQQIIETLIETYMKTSKPDMDAPTQKKSAKPKPAPEASEKPKLGKKDPLKSAATLPTPTADGATQDQPKLER